MQVLAEKRLLDLAIEETMNSTGNSLPVLLHRGLVTGAGLACQVDGSSQSVGTAS